MRKQGLKINEVSNINATFTNIKAPENLTPKVELSNTQPNIEEYSEFTI